MQENAGRINAISNNITSQIADKGKGGDIPAARRLLNRFFFFSGGVGDACMLIFL